MRTFAVIMMCGIMNALCCFPLRASDGDYESTTILKAGDAAADFTVPVLDGGNVSLSELKGKVVLLSFWATWCRPCLKELSPEGMPLLLEQFADEPDFVFLPIADDTSEELDRFFSSPKGSTDYAYLKDRTGVDPDRNVFGLYARQGIPRSFVIGKDGKIVAGFLGVEEDTFERMGSSIREALGQ
ncbi:MAG TPA: TlpA family protein disulfide reductase [Candidatus Coprenecus stercoripullorum]|nr:TlpA family protein disulfide reductase [Candidatus Coprenecus stercoripullorum]